MNNKKEILIQMINECLDEITDVDMSVISLNIIEVPDDYLKTHYVLLDVQVSKNIWFSIVVPNKALHLTDSKIKDIVKDFIHLKMYEARHSLEDAILGPVGIKMLR